MSKVNRFIMLDLAVSGSLDGSLHLFRFSALTVDLMLVSDFRHDFCKKKDMAVARSFCGHTSFVKCIELFHDKLIMTTSLDDQCIIQWQIEYEDDYWELDFNGFQVSSPDPYAEYPAHEKFVKL
jgi:hypothetical protein